MAGSKHLRSGGNELGQEYKGRSKSLYAGVVFPLLNDNNKDGAEQTAWLDLFLRLKMSGRDSFLRAYERRQTKALSF